MGNDIREADWKIFREIRVAVLARFCDRILSEVTALANDTAKGSHERYLLVFKRLKERDDEIAAAFNDFRRSTAVRQLAIMHSRGMITNEEIACFSMELQESLKVLSDLFRPKKRLGRRRDS